MRVGRAHWRNVMWFGIFLGAALFLGGADGGGCGGKSLFEGVANDNTTEAKIEKAKIALDEKDYTTAVNLLHDLCGVNLITPACDPQTVSLYAAAYSGRAGLDVFALIKEAATKAVVPGGSASFTLFSTHFADPTIENVNDMGAAVTLLENIKARTPDQGLQLAIVTTSDLVVFLGRFTGGYDVTTGKPKTFPDSSAFTAGSIARVSVDINNMATGLAEAKIANQNVAGHIQEIQKQLASADGAKIAGFLNSFQ